MGFVVKIFFGLVIFCVAFGSLVYLFGENIFLQPTQQVNYVRSISTTRVSSVATTLNLPQAYALDNADGFGWDFNGDFLTDFLAYSADRVLYLGHDNSERLFFDGKGMVAGNDEGSGANNALIVRIDDGSQNLNNYVVVKSGLANYLGAGVNSWDYRTTLEVYALNAFNTYSAGQKIADLSYINGETIYYIMGDVVAKPGQPAFLAVATRDFGKMSSYLLNVDTAGIVTLTSVNEIGCPIYPLNSNPGGEIPQCHRGNGMIYTNLCRTDSFGVNTGVCEKYLLNNEFFRISSTGAMTKVGDWFSINNQNIPIVGGGFEPISFRYGLSYGHVDAQFVVDRGTPQNPDYRLFILFDSGLRRIYSAKISIDANGVVTLIPQFATAGGGGLLPTAAQEIGLIGRVQGLQGGPYISNSEKLFDIDGNVVASINQQVNPFDCSIYVNSVSCNSEPLCIWSSADGGRCLLKSASWIGYPHSWPANYNGEYIFDELSTHGRGPYGYGFAGAGILAHLLPTATTTTNPNSGIAFENVGSALPSGSAMTISWFKRMAPFVEFNIDGFVKVKMVKFRNQQHASLLQVSDEGPVWQAQTQAQKDVWFAWAQHSNIASDRGYDSWSLWHNLDLTPGNAPLPPTNLQSSFT